MMFFFYCEIVLYTIIHYYTLLLTARDVYISRYIAQVRIHVERVIRRFKKFKILSSVIPLSQVDLLNEIMVTICGITNLNPSVVNV